jgi:uncharacterized protein YecE (DUF72 family)
VPVLIGTSGWHYAHWKGAFYPPKRPPAQWLRYYVERFATVESNNAFYRLPDASTFEGWKDTLPAGFVFAVKASRYLTHIKRLRDPVEPVHRLMDRASHLGDKLGPILLQLPPTLAADLDALDSTLTAFPGGVRVAVEFRHPSWLTDETRALLERRGAALCLADGGPLRIPLWRTAAWGYVRLHAGRAHPPSCYGPTALRSWAGRLADLWARGDDVHVYFNNDAHGCAPRDARRFAGAVRAAGLEPSRVPGPRETPLST